MEATRATRPSASSSWTKEKRRSSIGPNRPLFVSRRDECSTLARLPGSCLISFVITVVPEQGDVAGLAKNAKQLGYGFAVAKPVERLADCDCVDACVRQRDRFGRA